MLLPYRASAGPDAPKRIMLPITLAALAALVGACLVFEPGVQPARADYAPGLNDIVGVGSAAMQYVLDFGDNGDPSGDSGYNDAGNFYKVVSLDATADANGRAAYQNNSTDANLLPLDPTVVMRGGTYPVQRPGTSQAGMDALLADTSAAYPAVDFARTTVLPSAAQVATAAANGWGGLEVVSLAEDNIEMAVASSASNAPSGLSAEQLVQIYECRDTTWNQVGGTSGATIVPVIPQSGSETRTTFLADLQAANGSAVTLGGCVVTGEENDPAAITASSEPADTIEPFSGSVLNLWNGASGNPAVSPGSGTGYFRNPGSAYPGGSSLAAGVRLLTGAPSDGNPVYDDVRHLYVVYRYSSQVSATPWQPGGTLNWAQTLFCDPGGPTPFFATPAGQTLVAQAGADPDYSCASDLPAGTAPASPPVQVCGDSAVLAGPSSAPAGAVTVPAGDDSAMFGSQLPADTTYYFAAGTHYLGSGEYTQIDPSAGDVFIGAPGAVLSGNDPGSPGYVPNDFAFVGADAGVTGVSIKYLTIEDFAPPGGQGAVNTNSDDNWSIEDDTIQDNVPGAGLMIGSSNTVEYDCLTENGEYGFNAYQAPGDPQTSPVTGGPQDITLSDNEISYNNTCNWEAVSGFPITPPAGCAGQGEFNGCGCSGAGKFWQSQDVTVGDNYVHNNYGTGIWVDTDNDGFHIYGNYIASNYSEGLIYEISYNALIQDNAFIDNAWGSGPALGGFPDSAVYISESGGDGRVANSFGYATLDITGNVFTDNWGGVVLWENSNRFCGDGSDDACTLVDPSVATIASCQAALANPAENQPTDTPDYFDLCRWKTQNVTVSGNDFNFSPADIGSACTVANYCGFNGLFSEDGSTVPYTGWIVPLDISDEQDNVFAANTYAGPWSFDGFNQGDVVNWSQWTSGFEDDNGSGDFFDGQDAGSTYNPAPPGP